MNHQLKRCCRSKKKTSRKWLFLFSVASLTGSLFTFFIGQTNSVEVCYVNWRTVIEQTSLFLRLIVCLILGYFHDYYRRYGAWRIGLYLLFISLLSYFLVAHVLDSLALLCWEQLKGNVIRRLDDSVIIIDENRNETTSMIRTEKPKFLEEHFRYNNEDVRFRCYDFMIFESEVEPDSRQVIWKHNGEDIIPSWKFHIDFTFTEANVTSNTSLFSYFLNSTLTIYLIEDTDFGNYSCHMKESAKRKLKNYDEEKETTQEKSNFETVLVEEISDCSDPTCIFINEEIKELNKLLVQYYSKMEFLNLLLKLNSYVWAGEFKLSKIPSTITTKSAPPGGILSLSASYLNEAEKQDITISYFINNKPFHDVCSGRLSGCSLFVFMYWICWHHEGNFDGIPNLVGYWLSMTSSILARAWQCACPSTYGIHTFKFYRNFYNVSSGRHDVVEVDHPTRIRLIPRTADMLLIFQNDSKPQQFGEECLDSIPFTSSCSWLQCAINELDRNYFIIEYSVFFIYLCLDLFIAYIACKWTNHYITPVRNLILEQRVWKSLTESNSQEALGGIGNTGLPRKYDVYISHADAENDLARDLANILESFGKKVYFRDRDVAVGDTETKEVSEAIVTSSKYLVIVSADYISNGFQNSFEYHMILNEIYEKRIQEKDALLLKCGTCNIANFFHNFTDFEILDHDTICDEELRRKLKQWS